MVTCVLLVFYYFIHIIIDTIFNSKLGMVFFSKSIIKPFIAFCISSLQEDIKVNSTFNMIIKIR